MMMIWLQLVIVIVICFATANDNGKLEFDEFCEIVAKNRKSLDQEEEELRNAFRVFDRKGDGTVDRLELKEVLIIFISPYNGRKIT